MAKVSTILLNASVALQDDVGNVRWPLPELMRYLNDGLLELLRVNPKAYSETMGFSMQAGPQQEIDGIYAVLDVKGNLDGEGGSLTRAVRKVGLYQLNSFDVNWFTADQEPVVHNFALDPHERRRFWVQPPNDGTGFVQVEVAPIPDPVATTGGGEHELTSYDVDIPIDAVYAPALTYYVLHRAWAKDADFAANQQNSNSYYELFMAGAQQK